MKTSAKGKKVFLLLLLVCFFFQTVYSQSPLPVESADDNAIAAQQQKIVDEAINSLTIEIAKEYFVSKRDNLPKEIDTVPALKEYLRKVFPEDAHELRKAVNNLQLKQSPDFLDIKNYLKSLVQKYAVNLKSEPLKLNDKEIDLIINNAEKKLRQLSTPPMPVRTPSENNDLASFAYFLYDLFNPYSLYLLITIALLIAFRGILFFIRRSEKDGPHVHLPLRGSVYSPSVINTPATEQIKPPTVINDADSTLALEPEFDPEPVLTFIDEDRPVLNGAPNNWLVVKASVTGKSHIESTPPVPCQDSNYYLNLGQDWGIAIVCDGAGSKKFSHIGSRFVAECAGSNFRKIIMENEWQKNGILPTRDSWHEVAKRAFAKIRNELEKAAVKENVKAELFGCTIIVVIHSPLGILASHIGDGRAAYCNFENEWKPLIKPYKGEEANQTVFITSVDWSDQDNYIASHVFEEKPAAFALMSDGCETYSFEVNIYDETEQKYKDPNLPYPKFFQPVVNTLKDFHRAQLPPEEIDLKWKSFVESGNEKLKNEPDDKTMIVGVLLAPNT